MAQIFPRWTNRLPLIAVIAFPALVILIVVLFWYYASPWYTDVGYRPRQPVPYSHKLHAGDLKMDCRYCHTGVEVSPVSMVPPTKTCMNCHQLIKTESDNLALVRESWTGGAPLMWVRVHELPDFAYFDHSAHLRVGVGCSTCHGNVAAMEVVEQKRPLSMGWCLECHRHPESFLRRREDLTNMVWEPPADQLEFAENVMQKMKIKPPVACSGCHR